MDAPLRGRFCSACADAAARLKVRSVGVRPGNEVEKFPKCVCRVKACHGLRPSRVSAAAGEGSVSGDGFEKSPMDVSRAVVNPVFRSSPWAEESGNKDGKVHVLFVSESNVCRSVLAEAIFAQLVDEMGMSKLLACDSKGSRDYNLGDGPDPTVIQAAEDLGIFLPEGFQARMVDHARDIVVYDLLLAVDKFTLADVLREVSVFDTITREGEYSMKVRRLGEFHPVLAKSLASEGQDIDDPLYGNIRGSEELEAVKKAAGTIEAACLGLMQFFQDIQDQADGDPAKFKASVQESVKGMKAMDWLVPPMLQKKK